jgi:hypothetical protein
MTQYQTKVTMTTATVSALQTSGSYLYVFRAVQASDRAGRPVVWTRQPYSQHTYVNWSASYDAYTSLSPIKAGQEIPVGFFAAINVGELLQVTAGGIGTVTSAGHNGTISIQNTTSTPFTCGVGGGLSGDAAAPLCAFPLNGNSLEVVTPLDKIMLMFSTQLIAPGTVIDDFYGAPLSSFGPGVLIDLASANQRTLSYDINTGWSWGGYNWAREVPAGTNLVPLLIEPPAKPRSVDPAAC